MDKGLYLKIVRRVCTVLFVLILLVACSAQVHAEQDEETDTSVLSAMADDVMGASGLTEENFSAVAVQLEAVARTDGRASADRMLYDAFSSAAALHVSETAAVPVPESAVNVITVPEKRRAPTFGQIAALIAASTAAGVLLFFVIRRRTMRGTVYKPMRTGAANRNPYAGYGMVRTYK